MIRIIDGRGTGKTSQLMLLAKEHDADFVCSNPRAMEQKAKAYGINGINFISYSQFIDIGSEKEVVIDELENLLTQGICKNILGYTISNE